jgi:hypothetical protein
MVAYSFAEIDPTIFFQQKRAAFSTPPFIPPIHQFWLYPLVKEPISQTGRTGARCCDSVEARCRTRLCGRVFATEGSSTKDFIEARVGRLNARQDVGRD